MENPGDPNGSRAPRLRSLDALRGFDMLWIVGLAALVREVARLTDVAWIDLCAEQLEHVPWEGLRAYDLVFPLFMFLAGMSVPYAITARISRGEETSKIFFGIVRRVVLLVILGAVYNGLLQLEFEEQRYASVLGQIGIAYGIAATTYLWTRSWTGRWFVCLLILGGVAAMQLMVPVPEVGAGVLTPEGIINGWIDRRYLPGRLHGGAFDPEGWLSILSASALVLWGVLVGEAVKNRGSRPRAGLAVGLLFAGGLAIASGWICWEMGYPPIKAAWTTTFNLLAGGICVWLFLLFHLTIDTLPRLNWSLPLQVVGANPLTIYLAHRIVPFMAMSAFVFGGMARLAGEWETPVLIAGLLVIEWLLLFFLYRKRIFFRL
jgi:predicted acyltransferase